MTMHVVSVVPVITAGIYSALDAVGGLLNFSNALRHAGFTGTICGAVIIDEGDQGAALGLQLFDRTFTPTADNAAYDPSDADIKNAIANILFPAAGYAGGATNLVSSVGALALPCVGQGPDLFGQLWLTAGTPTYAAVDDLTVKLFIR